MTDTEQPTLDLFGRITMTLDTITSRLAEQERANAERLKASVEEAPKFDRFHGTVTLDSNGFGVFLLDHKGPQQGHFWYIRNLVIGGLTPATATSGRVDVFVSAMDMRTITGLAQIGSADWRDSATSLPTVRTYNRGGLTLQSPDRLWVIISGGTATQAVVCAGDVEDYQEGTAPNRLGF